MGSNGIMIKLLTQANCFLFTFTEDSSTPKAIKPSQGRQASENNEKSLKSQRSLYTAGLMINYDTYMSSKFKKNSQTCSN